jgi:hypothetical protein
MVFCLFFSFLNDLDRVTDYNYVPSDGAHHHTQSWPTFQLMDLGR